MKIIKGKLKEAYYYSFDDLCDDLYPEDRDSKKEMRKLKYDFDRIINDFSVKDNTTYDNPRTFYFNISEYVEQFLNKVAADYHLGNTKNIEEFSLFKDALNDYLDRTNNFTKNAIKQVDTIEKYLSKLPKKN